MSVSFTLDSAKRIVRSTRTVERADFGRDVRRPRTITHGTPEILTVEITSQDANDPTKFAWALAFRRDDSTWDRSTRTGEAFALDETDVTDLTGQHVFIASVAIERLIAGTDPARYSMARGWVIIGGAGGDSTGIHQGQVHTQRTDAQDGWQLNSFAPGDSDLLP